MKKTIMIFGVSSFVGANLAELLKDEYRIIGTYHKTPILISGVNTIPCDVLKKDYVSKLVAIFKPHYSIYCAGLSSLNDCAFNPKKADALNSVGPANCAGASERYGSKFIYISSSFVLGGEDILHKEGDTPFPTTIYGNSLLSAEFFVQRSCLNYLIFRCAPIFGRSINPFRPNWFEYLQADLAKKNIFQADDFITTGFLDVYTLAEIIKKTLSVISGNKLFHVSSSNFMTRFEFSKTYAKIFAKDPDLLQSSSGNFPSDNSKRSLDKADSNEHYFKIDTSFLEEYIDYKMPSVEEMLQKTKKYLSR